jgi:cyclopropane-fatty-acyl-phospholipid synthase
MASQQEIAHTYDFLDEYLRASLGECFDYSSGIYDGDGKRSLADAQHIKHEYVLSSLRFKPGMRILDIGCGWGPMLKAITEKGGKPTGITLSPAQMAVNRGNGFSEVHVLDWKHLDEKRFGTFDAVLSNGAFEHFCSVEEHLAGKQDEIYRSFFTICASVLPKGARLYLQTMVGGKVQIPYSPRLLESPKDSNEYMLGLMEKLFPGSWLPMNAEQIIRAADPVFSLVEQKDGTDDFIKTIDAWRKPLDKMTGKKLWMILKHLPRIFFDRDTRYQIESGKVAANLVLLERGVWDEVRYVFEKR